MLILHTWEDLARALDSPLDPALKGRLQGQFERLTEWQEDYDLEDLAVFVIIQAGDTLEQAEGAIGRPLVNDGHFTLLPELIDQYPECIEATFILSDDGLGFVLLAEEGPGADPRLMQAFSNAAATLDKLAIR